MRWARRLQVSEHAHNSPDIGLGKGPAWHVTVDMRRKVPGTQYRKGQCLLRVFGQIETDSRVSKNNHTFDP